ncbi:MAG: hypothetical protein KDE32_13245 [Novosphingobium sp.]|nr:hypothetical protein [Novosphingobium sp.]
MPAPAPPVGSEPALTWIALGQTANVGGLQVRPISVAEDSRCPQGVQCVWAGRVVVQTHVTYASGSKHIERLFVTGERVPVADGTLTLVDASPPKTTAEIRPADYRFAYRFDGGL